MRSGKETDVTEDQKGAQKLNNLFNKIIGKQRSAEPPFGKYSQTPLMDLIERRSEIIAKVDLPGVAKKDIVLEI